MVANDAAKTIQTDGSVGDTQNAVNYMVGKAQDGWVITIGSANTTYNWGSSTLSTPNGFNHSFVIQGAGSGSTRTRISASGSQGTVIALSVTDNKLAQLTNLIFNDSGTHGGGFLNIDTAVATAHNSFRVDHCDFNNCNPFAVKVCDDDQSNSGICYGLFDHCLFSAAAGVNGIYMFAGRLGNQWTAGHNMTWGTVDTICIEDCTFTASGATVPGRPAIDSAYYGVRWLVRYCNFTNWVCVLHGADSTYQNEPSTLQIEFHHNTLTVDLSDYGLYLRGGAAMCSYNTFQPPGAFPNQCYKFANDSPGGYEKVGTGTVNGVDTRVGAYFWSNTFTGQASPNGQGIGGMPSGLSMGVDVFNVAPGPGLPTTSYTELSHPHPLIAPSDTTPPSAPQPPFSATALSATQMTVNWGAASDNQTPAGSITYLCEHKTGAGSFSQFGTVTGTTTIVDSGLNPNTVYTYQIRAQDAASPPNTGSYSTSFSGTTLAADSQPPSIPANFQVGPGSPTFNSVPLQWTASIDNQDSAGQITYTISRKTGAGSFSPIVTTNRGVTQYTDSSGLSPSTTYQYEILATDSSSNSSLYSSPITATTAAAPSNPTCLQHNHFVPGPDSPSLSTTFTSAQVAGNCNLAWVWCSNGVTISSVTDTAGNAYSLLTPQVLNSNGAWRVGIYISNQIKASSAGNVVTATFSAITWCELIIAEYRGVATVSPLDVTTNTSGQNTTTASVAITPLTNFDTIIAWIGLHYPTSTPTVPTNYALVETTLTDPGTSWVADRQVSTLATNTPVWNWTVANPNWTVINIAIKAGVADVTKPSVPAIQPVTSATTTSLTVNWSASTDDTTPQNQMVYLVEHRQEPSGSFVQIAPPPSTTGLTSIVDSGLASNTTYTYRVRAQDLAGNISDYPLPGNYVQGTTLAASGATPTVPTNFVVTNRTSNSISLQWLSSTDTDNASNTLTYTLQRQTGGGAFSVIATGIAGVATGQNVSYIDSSGLSPSTTYGYQVEAVDPAPTNNHSGFTSTLNATTLGGVSTPSFVQSGVGTTTATFAASQTSGNTNIVVVGWQDTTATISSVNDSSGNNYVVQIATAVSGLSQSIYVCTPIAPHAANNVVTVLFNGTPTLPDVRVAEYTSVDTVTPVEMATFSSGIGNTAICGPLPVVGTNDLLFSADTATSATTGIDPTFTQRAISSRSNIIEDRALPSAGSFIATARFGGAVYYVSSSLGSDGNTGTSPGSPWQDCPGMGTYTGSGSLAPGDTVYFYRSDTWSMPASGQGLYTSPGVTYIGNSWGTGTGKAHLRATGLLDAGVVRFRDHATFETVIEGFEVDCNQQDNNGVDINHRYWQLMNGATKRLKDCDVHDIYSRQANGSYHYGIIASASGGAAGLTANVEIIGCTCYNTSRDAICLYPTDSTAGTNLSNVTVRGCEAWNTGQDPGYGAGAGLLVKGSITNAFLEYNCSHDTKGAQILINCNETNSIGGETNIHIRHNIFIGNNNVNGAIRIFDSSTNAGGDPKDLKIYGNIVYNSYQTGGLYIGAEVKNTFSLLCYNNTFYNAPVSIQNFSGATVGSFEFRNNICIGIGNGVPLTDVAAKIKVHTNNVYRTSSGNAASSGGTGYTNATVVTNYEASANSSDPAFVNTATLPTDFSGFYGSNLAPSTNGLSLPANSPDVASGFALAAPYNGSINSVTRVSGAWDRGAYNRVGVALPTPVMVQHVASGVGIYGVGNVKFSMPNTVGTGNCLIVGVHCNSAATAISVSDNAANTWLTGPTTTNASNAKRLSVFYILGAKAGTKNITVTFTGLNFTLANGNDGFPHFAATEFYNVVTSGTLDKSSSNSSSVAPGAMTTTSADLVWHWGVNVSSTNDVGGNWQGTAAVTAGAGFTLLHTDLQIGSVSQFLTQTSAGTVTPTFTTPTPAATWASVALAIPAAPAGTAPAAGIRIVRIQHTLLNSYRLQGSGSGGNSARDSACKIQFPTSGNLIVGGFNSGSGTGILPWITAISDSTGTTWAPTNVNRSQDAGITTSAQIVYCVGAPPSQSRIITSTVSPTNTGDGMFLLYDIIGANAAPFDKTVGTNGDQTSFGTIAMGSPITPAVANGLIINVGSIDFHTCNSLSGGGTLDAFVNNMDDDDPADGGPDVSPLDMDNPYGHYYNLNTSAVNFTYGFTGPGANYPGIRYWASISGAFKP